MRILLFVHSLRRGGAERVLLEVALGLRAKAHDVEIVSLLDVDEYREERYRLVPRHFLMPKEEYRWPWAVSRAAVRLKQVAERYRPDVIEMHTPTVAWVAAWANLDIPYIHVFHGYGAITRSGSIKDWGVRMVDRWAQRRLNANCIVVVPPMADVGATHFALAPSRFSCVPNGVDLSKFRPRVNALENTPTILMLGTLSPNKGQTLGVQAIRVMSQWSPNVRLRIVGEGPDREALGSLVKGLGLEGRVELLGCREDVPELMAEAHVLWQLSESEGMSMVVLEAMATGLPVVGFDVRGTRDVVVHGKTGYLVPFGDVKMIAQRTADLLNDVATYRMISQHARHRVEHHFSLESMVDGHERVLRAVTVGKR